MIKFILGSLIFYVSVKILWSLLIWFRQVFSSNKPVINNKTPEKKKYKNIEDADFEDISDKK